MKPSQILTAILQLAAALGKLVVGRIGRGAARRRSAGHPGSEFSGPRRG